MVIDLTRAIDVLMGIILGGAGITFLGLLPVRTKLAVLTERVTHLETLVEQALTPRTWRRRSDDSQNGE
jgi:hypothetical protein